MICQFLDNGHQTDTILLDFIKAFDKITHKRLLLKLQGIGIEGFNLDCIGSFLIDHERLVLQEGSSRNENPRHQEFHKALCWGPCCSFSIQFINQQKMYKSFKNLCVLVNKK